MKPNGFVSKGIHGLVLVVTIFSISGFGIFVPTMSAQAARTVNSIQVNGSTAVTVNPGSSINTSVNVTTSGSGSNNDWHSTRYQVEGQSTQCVNTADHNSSGTYTEAFSVTAPSNQGTYNLTIRAYQGDNCSGDFHELTLTDGITVQDNLTITNVTVNGTSSVTVQPNASVQLDVYVTTFSPAGGESNDWESTQYRIQGGSWSCVNTTDHTINGSYTEMFSIIAPASQGVYDLDVRVYDNDACSHGQSDTYTLSDAITVELLPVTIDAYKIICPSEDLLPDWGPTNAIKPDSITQWIQSGDAAKWVNDNGCQFATDWNFEWAYDPTDDPKEENNKAGWNTFNVNSPATFTDLGNGKIWVREAVNSAYIPFDGTTNTTQEKVSAEMYCSDDILNYDNFEWIGSEGTPLENGHTYNCVGFNVLAAYCGDNIINQQSEQCDGTAGEFGPYQSCNQDCQIVTAPYCGDGVKNNDEQCDGEDGVLKDQSCTESCTVEQTAGSIEICKYNDMDANEAYSDQIDTPLAWGFTVEAMSGEAFGNIWETATNSETGCVTLGSMPLGAYLVTEESRDGWVATYPASRTQWVELPDPNNQSYEVSTMFLNTQVYDIHGLKFNDLNGNGIRDCKFPDYSIDTMSVIQPECEPTLNGWTIFIDENGNGLLDAGEKSMVTQSHDGPYPDKDGWYWFEDLVPGTYEMCEIPQAGWQQTYPLNDNGNCHTITLPYGQEGDTCGLLRTLQMDTLVQNAVLAPMCNFGNHESTMPTISKSVLVNGEVSSTANEGDTLSYTVTVTNPTIGTPFTDLYLEDTLPTNTTLVPNWGGDLGDPSVNGTLFTWGAFELAPGETKSITFDVTVNADLPIGTTEIENQATLYEAPAEKVVEEEVGFLHKLLGIKTVYAADPEWTMIAQSNIVLTTVTIDQPETPETPEEPGIVAGDETEPKLTITKTAEHEFVNPGDTLAYTIVVKNTGDGSALNVTVKDTLPADFTFSDQSTTKTWDLGTIAAGAEQKVIYDVTISKDALEGYYENIAVASADNHDDVGAVAAVDVRKPAVLGDSIPDTGASSMDYVIFSISFMMIASGVYFINRKPLFVKRTIK